MNGIKDAILSMKDEYSVAKALQFYDYLYSCAPNEILDSVEYIFAEPIKGHTFVMEYMLTNDFSQSVLLEIQDKLGKFISNAESKSYDNIDHLNSIKSILDLVNAKIDVSEKLSMLDIELDNLFCDDMVVVMESKLTTAERNKLKPEQFGLPKKRKYPLVDPVHVMAAISYFHSASLEDQPELAKNIMKAIDKFNLEPHIKDGTKFKEYYDKYKKDNVLESIRIVIGHDNNSESIKSILNRGISDSDRIDISNKVIEDLKNKQNFLDTTASIATIVSTTTVIIQSVMIAIPTTVLALIGPIPVIIANKIIQKGIKKINRKVYIRTIDKELRKVEAVIKSGQVTSVDILNYRDNLKEAKNILSVGGVDIKVSDVASRISIENVTYDDITDIDKVILEKFYIFSLSENETIEESVSIFNDIVALDNIRDIILESKVDDDRRKKINVSANKVRGHVQDVKDKARNTAQAAVAAKNHINKAGKAIDGAATRVVNSGKDVYRNDIRGEIIESKTTIKLGRLIRKGIGVGTLALMNPAMGALAALTTIALRKNVKEKEKKKILNELNEELEIVNEKIDDSRGDENKEKKYQLMRIRNQLQRDIKRIQFNLKSVDKGV